jgi:hypothetical protein
MPSNDVGDDANRTRQPPCSPLHQPPLINHTTSPFYNQQHRSQLSRTRLTADSCSNVFLNPSQSPPRLLRHGRRDTLCYYSRQHLEVRHQWRGLGLHCLDFGYSCIQCVCLLPTSPLPFPVFLSHSSLPLPVQLPPSQMLRRTRRRL